MRCLSACCVHYEYDSTKVRGPCKVVAVLLLHCSHRCTPVVLGCASLGNTHPTRGKGVEEDVAVVHEDDQSWWSSSLQTALPFGAVCLADTPRNSPLSSEKAPTCLPAGFLPLYTLWLSLRRFVFRAKPTVLLFFFFFLLPACLLYTVLYYDHELYYIRRIYYICIYTHQSGTVNNELKAYASPKSGSLLAHTLLSHALFSVEGIDILTQPAVHLPQLLKSHRTMYGFVTRRCDGCSNTHI